MKILFRAAGVTLAAVLVPGCGEHLSRAVLPNQPPEVQVTQSLNSVPRGHSGEYRARWTGRDPDGRIDHFVYALNPASVDRVDESWVRTRETEWALTARVPVAESGGRAEREPTVLAVRAVDNRGALSPPRWAAFFPGNIPPTVMITSPKPTSLLVPILGQTVRFIWTGDDPDGQTTARPVKYKFKLFAFHSSEFPINVALANPDSLRRYYAPHFFGWDSTGADSTQIRFQNLVIGEQYLFVVTGFDEVGDYDPVFSLEWNMYRFSVGYSKTLGPQLALFGDDGLEFLGFPGYADNPSPYARTQVGSNRLVSFGWSAFPMPGSEVAGYRWVLDPVDLYDERTRTDPADLRHWSPQSLTDTAVTLGPFTAGPKGTPHRLYVEAEGTNGLRSLGIIHFTVIDLTFARDLLIVDDTRMRADNLNPATQCMFPPGGPWPNAAELDTFLYARGGFPWRCYPAGTLTEPGLFDGYDFDTLGTRIGRLDLTVSLSKLGRYRHVIWLVDGGGAKYFNLGTHGTQPQTTLRYMTVPGRFNSLASYIRQGGKVWLVGGGGCYASGIEWNDRANDQPPDVIFSSITSMRRELAPGRFMYDMPHWRSEIRMTRAPLTAPSGVIVRYSGRFGDSASTSRPGSPYADLTQRMRPKGEGVRDLLPPLRTNPNDFYQTTFDLEFLQVENRILEGVSDESTLDTIYRASSLSLPLPQQNPHNVVMTYYHGPDVPGGFVFTGFSLWNFKREDCQGLVDFVLQRIWGLSRSPSVSRAASTAATFSRTQSQHGRAAWRGGTPAAVSRQSSLAARKARP